MEEGLSDEEIAVIEQRHGFTFPLDLRLFLQHQHPCGEGWPNWRQNVIPYSAASTNENGDLVHHFLEIAFTSIRNWFQT